MSGAAYADDSAVTLYGILDTGVATVSNVQIAPAEGTTPAKSGRLTGLENGGINTSRWGIKGIEDLGNGLKARFQLESQLLPSNGTNVAGEVTATGTAGSTNTPVDTETQLFRRAAWVGLGQDGIGEIRLGRQNTIQYDYVTTYDALPAYNVGSLATNIDATAAKAGSGNVFNTYVVDRYDNAVEFRTADLSGFVGRAGYAFGDVVGSSSQGRIYDVGGEFHYDDLRLAASYLSKANPEAATAEVPSGTETTVYGVFATYDFKVALVNLSYTDTKGKFTNGQGFSTITLGSRFPIGQYTLIAEYAHDDNQQSGDKPWIASGGVLYNFSKRTSVYGLLAYAHQNGTNGATTAASRLETVNTSNFINSNGGGAAPVAGDNQTTLMIGIDHKF
jgi:predicted porin